jgi:hypothetical protein
MLLAKVASFRFYLCQYIALFVFLCSDMWSLSHFCFASYGAPSAKPHISHTKPSHRALITGEMNEKGRFLPKAIAQKEIFRKGRISYFCQVGFHMRC